MQEFSYRMDIQSLSTFSEEGKYRCSTEVEAECCRSFRIFSIGIIPSTIQLYNALYNCTLHYTIVHSTIQ